MSGKYIIYSVGLDAANNANDVATVQYLLNCVPTSHGGPSKELAIDGISGVLTNGAISRFQKAQFGWFDGRVDPESSGGSTIIKLKAYDPLPFSAPIVAPNYRTNGDSSTEFDGWTKGQLKGKKFSGGPGRPATAAELAPEIRVFRLPGKGELQGKKHSGV